MSKLVLEFHDWREMKADKDSELVATFLFSLTTENDRQAGVRLDRNHAFWTEVCLSRDLAGRGRWPQLSKTDRIRAMFKWAQEKIRQRGHKLRQAPMFWIATSPLADGPPSDWNLSALKFPKADPVVFETTDELHASAAASREAAGLNK